MKPRSTSPGAASLLPLFLAAALWSGSATAGPVLSVGGDLAPESTTDVSIQPPLPLWWIAVRGHITEAWSAFVRVGYDRDVGRGSTAYRVPLGGVGPGCVDCPQVSSAEHRATFVPVSWGVRLASSSSQRVRGFVEAASSLSWTRLERDVRTRYTDGHTVREVHASERRLAWIEIGAGVHHALSESAGIEWGVRYAYSAPGRTDANTQGDRDALSRIALTAALTVGR